MRRHLEAAKLDKAKAPCGPVRRIELVDTDFGAVRVACYVRQHVAQQTVDQPGRRRVACARRWDLRKGDLQLIERVSARLVDPRRLARRADKEAGEKITERRVTLPEKDQRFQEVRAPQKGAVIGGRAADDDMIAAAGSRMAAVDHELVGAKSAQARLFIDRLGRRDAVVPAMGRMNVHLDDAGVGRDADHVQARIMGRRVAFDMDGQPKLRRRRFRRVQQRQIVLDILDRRHEDAKPPVARLDRKRSSNGAADGQFLLNDRLAGPGGING